MFLFNFSLYDYTQSLSIIKCDMRVCTLIAEPNGSTSVSKRHRKKCIFTLFVVFRHLCVPEAIKPDEKCGVTIMKSFENLSGSISVSCLPNLADDDDKSETFLVFFLCLPTHFYANKLCPERQHRRQSYVCHRVNEVWGKGRAELKNWKEKQTSRRKQTT